MADRTLGGCLGQALLPGGGADGCVSCHGGRDSATPAAPHDIAGAQRAADLRAANLAADGDQARFDELLDLITTSPPPAEEEVQLSGTTAFRDPSPILSTQRPDAETVSKLLRALVLSDITALAWLHIGVEGLSLHLSQARGIRRPTVTPPLAQWAWRDLLGTLPDDSTLPDGSTRLRFHLAGGTVESGGDLLAPAATAAALRAALPDLDALLPAGSALVVINGSRRWPLIDRVAHDAGWVLGGAALLQCPTSDPTALIAHLTRQAPLAHPYELVLADPDRTGATRVTSELVFGDGIGLNAEETVSVYAPVGVAGPITLPFVMRDQAGDWEPVTVARAGLERGRVHTLKVGLDDDAQVIFPDRWDVEEDPRPFDSIIAAMPRACSPDVDIVFLFEAIANPRDPRSGKTDTPAYDRLNLVREAVWAISREACEPDRVRVGLVHYGQHTPGTPHPIRVAPIGDPVAAARVAAAWKTLDDNQNDLAAALEDALAEVPRLGWRTDYGVKRILVTIGSRPPYPTSQADQAAAGRCSLLLEWERVIADLDQIPGLLRVGVWAEPDWSTLALPDAPARDRGDRAWAQLSRDRRLDPATTTVDSLLTLLSASFADPAMTLAYPVSPHTTPLLPL
jgi:hypothetical protein